MPNQTPPNPTRLYRIVHVGNLHILLTRDALHAHNHTPNDGLTYLTIHNAQVQQSRNVKAVPCGPRGVIHDYVPFYFGPHSVMLLNLHTKRVPGYTAGQGPLIYLVTSVQEVITLGRPFVFSDGHGLASFTHWYDKPAQLDMIDWSLVGQRQWADTPSDNDRKRRKQAEFLVHETLAWQGIEEIGVLNQSAENQVNQILSQFPNRHHPPVKIRHNWYY